MIQNLIFGILLLKIFFRHATFYIHPSVPVDIIKVFFDFRFSSQQKLLIRITYFPVHFRSKDLTHFTNLNSLDVKNNMLPKHS